MMAFTVIYLEAVGLVFMRGREVASYSHQYGPFLDKRAMFVKQGYACLEILFLVLRHFTVLYMNTYCGQACYLIKTAVIPGSRMPEECQFGNGRMLCGRAYIAHIAHATAYLYVVIGHQACNRFFLNHIQGDSVHKGGIVCPFQHT